MNVKNEFQCIATLQLLKKATIAGLYTEEESEAIRTMVIEKYSPETICK